MGYLSLVSALSRRTSYTRVGMLDLDRVEMILPQVHLRNGECCGLLTCYATPGATVIRTSAGLSRGAFPRPPSSPAALLSQGSD